MKSVLFALALSSVSALRISSYNATANGTSLNYTSSYSDEELSGVGTRWSVLRGSAAMNGSTPMPDPTVYNSSSATNGTTNGTLAQVGNGTNYQGSTLQNEVEWRYEHTLGSAPVGPGFAVAYNTTGLVQATNSSVNITSSYSDGDFTEVATRYNISRGSAEMNGSDKKNDSTVCTTFAGNMTACQVSSHVKNTTGVNITSSYTDGELTDVATRYNISRGSAEMDGPSPKNDSTVYRPNATSNTTAPTGNVAAQLRNGTNSSVNITSSYSDPDFSEIATRYNISRGSAEMDGPSPKNDSTVYRPNATSNTTAPTGNVAAQLRNQTVPAGNSTGNSTYTDSDFNGVGERLKKQAGSANFDGSSIMDDPTVYRPGAPASANTESNVQINAQKKSAPKVATLLKQ